MPAAGERSVELCAIPGCAVSAMLDDGMMAGVVSPDLGPRIVSAIVLVGLAIATTLTGGLWFKALWYAAAFACFYEVLTIGCGGFRPLQCLIGALGLLLASDPTQFSAWSCLGFVAVITLLAFLSPPGRRWWSSLGFIYAAMLLGSMIILRASTLNGVSGLVWIFAIVWASDIAAYFTGRAIGGPKLLPSISPNKTWSGFVGGTLGGILAAAITATMLGLPIHWQMIALAGLLSIVSAIGDLLESAFKRYFGVKDSGRIIPGHGGVLDRLDGFMLAAIAAVVFGSLRDVDAARGLLVW